MTRLSHFFMFNEKIINMVSNYIDNNCKYNLNKLVNVVYMIDEDAVKDIRIDNGDAYIASISQNPLELKCYGIKLTENDSLDERYKFTHTLTFSVKGYANHTDFQGRYYVIVKDEEGTYWLVNPLFPCKVTYTYNLGYNQDHTDFTLATVSNHPMLEIHNFGIEDIYECDGYWLGGIDKLWLNEKRYTKRVGNTVKYTNGGFKEVDFRKTSGVLTETFDGEKLSHSIKFNIGFDNYKSSWHYNLLEFISNTYASVVKTKNNEYTLCGFSYGMQPSYTINADDTKTTNNIAITLTDAHADGDTLAFYDEIEYEYLSGKTWEYTKEHDGYECTDAGTAIYLLKKEVDAFGNETGRFMVHEGYRSAFSDLNLVDEEFSEDVEFVNMDCNGNGCMIYTSFPSNIVFYDRGSKEFTIKTDTEWSIESSSDNITLSRNNGNANRMYSVTVTNSLTPTSTPVNSTLTITYCNTSRVINVVVTEDTDACLYKGTSYNISANQQTVTIPSNCCITAVKEMTNIGVQLGVYSNYFTVQVPNNNSGINRNIILLVMYCDGTSQNVTIYQSNVFEKWTSEGTECFGRDLYTVERLYTGSTSGSITARTDTVRNELLEVNSRECITPEKEDFPNGYICDECTPTKYYNNYSDSEIVETGACDSTTLVRADIRTPSALTYSQVGSCVKSIGNGAFSGCTSLEGVMLPSGLETIGDDAFNVCYAATWISIPQTVTSIGNRAFRYCTVMGGATLPNGLTSLGSNAFERCSNFATINIPKTLTYIPSGCFTYNHGLSMIDLHDGITSIGDSAFYHCYGLNYVICRRIIPPTIGTSVFGQCPILNKIYVPAQSVDTYKTTSGWSEYSSIIYPIE